MLVDRDQDDCHQLKATLEKIAEEAGIITKTADLAHYHLINRIVVEEIEAWFFGDVAAICQAYASVPASLANRANYRIPDEIKGGRYEQYGRNPSYSPG